MRTAVSIGGKVLVGAAGAASGTALTLRSGGIYHPTEAQTAAYAVMAGTASFVLSLPSVLGQVRAARTERTTRTLQHLARGALFTVSDLTSVDVRELGISVWRRHNPRARPWAPDELRREVRERAVFDQAVTPIKWTLDGGGKGVIGRCVTEGRALVFDTATQYAPYLDEGQAAWAAAPDGVRLGLTFGDFTAIRGKYGAVVAVPIVSPPVGAAPKVVGCVCLDGPSGSYEVLTSKKVLKTLGECVESILQMSDTARIMGSR